MRPFTVRDPNGRNDYILGQCISVATEVRGTMNSALVLSKKKEISTDTM